MFNFLNKIKSRLFHDKWTHEVREQWYNNEVQSTTNLLENSKVEDVNQ